MIIKVDQLSWYFMGIPTLRFAY